MPTAPLVDPITLKVSGEQYEQFANALIDAFPGYPELQMMTKFRLDLQLATIAGANTGLGNVVFLLIQDQKAKGHFLRLLAAARSSQPGNPRLASFAEQFNLAMETPPAPQLELIVVDTNSFLDINTWRERLAEIEARVCRVEVNTNNGMGYGTGFLVGPDLVLTNYHVVDSVIAGERNEYTPAGTRAKKTDVVLRFDYKELPGGARSQGVEVKLAEIIDHSPFSPIDLQPLPKQSEAEEENLDYALLKLETRPGAKPFGSQPIGDKAQKDDPARGTIPIPAANWTFQKSTPLFIVQHPDSKPMKLALDTDAVLEANTNNTRVRYKTNTLGGSSGSPCFNQNLELVALHHAGDPNYGLLYHPQFNEGIPIAKVRDLIKKRNKAEGITIQ